MHLQQQSSSVAQISRAASCLADPTASSPSMRPVAFGDPRLFGAAFLACLVVYGYPLTNFSLHIDVEAATAYGSVEHTFVLGRWGLSLVHMFILPEPVVPYFTTLLTLLFLSAAALVAEGVFRLPTPQRFAFVILYVSFPQFAYQLEFGNQSDCVAFGILCGSLSFVALQRFLAEESASRQAALLLGSIALLLVGTSFYEAIVFTVPVLCTLMLLQRALDGSLRLATFLRAYACSALVTVVAYGACALLGRLFQHIFALTPSNYLDNMIGWRTAPFGKVASRAFRWLMADVMGGGYYGNGLFRIAVAAAVVIVGCSVVRRLPPARILSAVVLGIASLLAPFAIVLLLGGQQPPRTFLTEQIVFAAVLVFALSAVGARPSLQAALVAAVVLASSFHVSRLFVADAAAWTSDKLIGNRIVQQMYAAEPTFSEDTTPVYFYGAYTQPNLWAGADYDMFGKSMLAWDGGASYRIIAFLHAAGIANLKLPTPQDALRVEPALTALPTWPNPNAIRLINGVMVVRLGP